MMTAPEIACDQLPATVEDFFNELTLNRDAALIKIIKMKKKATGRQTPIETYCAGLEPGGGRHGSPAPTITASGWGGAVPPPSMASAIDKAAEWNAEFSVYFMPNGTSNPDRMVNANDEIDDFRALFADCDNPALSEAAVAYWKQSDYPPSAIIETTPNADPDKLGKVQAFWFLDGVGAQYADLWQSAESKLIADTNDFLRQHHGELFEIVEERINPKTGKLVPATTKEPIDPSASNPCRPLRWPGSINHKTKPGKQGRIVGLNINRYKVEVLREMVPHVEKQTPTPRTESKPSASKARKFNDVIDALTQTGAVKKAHPPEEGKPSYTICCPWADNHTDPNDDDAAIYEPSDKNNYGGGFKCQHNSCADKDFKSVYGHLFGEGQKVHVMGPVKQFIDEADTLLIVIGGAGAMLVHNSLNFPLVALPDYSSWEDHNPANLVLQPVPELMELLMPGITVYVMMEAKPEEKSDNFSVARLAMFLNEAGVSSHFVLSPEPYDEWRPSGKLREMLPKMEDAAPLESFAGRYLTGDTVDAFINLRFDETDRGVATYIIRSNGKGNLIYVAHLNNFFLWNGHKWESHGKNPRLLIDTATYAIDSRKRVLLERLRNMGAFDIKVSEWTDEMKGISAEAKSIGGLVGYLSSNKGADNVANTLKVRRSITMFEDKFDIDMYTLGTPSGIIDLRTGELRRPRREDYVTRSTKATYTPNLAPTHPSAARIEKFFREVFADAHGQPNPVRHDYMQEVMGSALIGTSRRVVDCLDGDGANGKSTSTKLVQGAIGKGPVGYFAKAPSGFLTARRSKEPSSATPDLAHCNKSRVVVVSEPPAGAAFNEAAFKEFVGGEDQTVRALYQGFSDYQTTYSIWLLFNEFPDVAHGDQAFWDRVAPFKFKCRWRNPNAIGVSAADALLPEGDPWLIDEAFRDPDAIAYVLSWLVAGCVRYYQNGKKFTQVPADVEKLKQQHKDKANNYPVWMAEKGFEQVRYSHDAETRVRVSVLAADYNEWIGRVGSQRVRGPKFADHLCAHVPGLEQVRVGGIDCITGIRRDPKGACLNPGGRSEDAEGGS